MPVIYIEQSFIQKAFWGHFTLFASTTVKLHWCRYSPPRLFRNVVHRIGKYFVVMQIIWKYYWFPFVVAYTVAICFTHLKYIPQFKVKAWLQDSVWNLRRQPFCSRTVKKKATIRYKSTFEYLASSMFLHLVRKQAFLFLFPFL